MAGCSHSSELTVDSKGLCLLCLKPCLTLEPTSLSSQHGLKHLLSYLQVNVSELFNGSPAFSQLMDFEESFSVRATLCSRCSSVTQEFNRCYQESELSMGDLDNCVETVYELINDGDQNPDRFEEFVARMRSQDAEGSLNFSFVYNLRSEALRKCDLKIQGRSPFVTPNPLIENIMESNRCDAVSDSANVNIEQLPDPPAASSLSAIASNYSCLSTPLKKSIKRKKGSKSSNMDANVVNYEANSEISSPSNRTIAKKKRVSRTCAKISKTCTSKTERSKTPKPPASADSDNIHQCLFCDYVAKTPSALKLHRIDHHLLQMIKDSLRCTVSDVECAQAIDSVYLQMIKSNRKTKRHSCFKCKHASKRKVSLKRHAVDAHFEEFLQLVENRVNEMNENDGRNQSLLDYLGLTRNVPNNGVDTNTDEDEDVDVVNLPDDDATPGCSKDLCYAQRSAVRLPFPLTARSSMVPTASVPRNGPNFIVKGIIFQPLELVLTREVHLGALFQQISSHAEPIPEEGESVVSPPSVNPDNPEIFQDDVQDLSNGTGLSADVGTCPKGSQELNK